MKVASRASVAPLLTSGDGIHLSVYLENTKDSEDLRLQLQESLSQAAEILRPVMSPATLASFLGPFRMLMQDQRSLRSFRDNIAIFRRDDLFRVVNIPVQVQNLCIVATSFHVKPLLRWLQERQEFLLADMAPGMARIYRCTDGVLTSIESMPFAEPQAARWPGSNTMMGSAAQRRRHWDVALAAARMDYAVRSICPDESLPLVITGKVNWKGTLRKMMRYRSIMPEPVLLQPAGDHARPFKKATLEDTAKRVADLLLNQAERDFHRKMEEFTAEWTKGRTQAGIFSIASLAVQGRIRKLVVADDLQIFGKLDRRSGKVHLSSVLQDHEDDDILDDVAQEVLSRGGEVLVCSRERIPFGRAALAITDDPAPHGYRDAGHYGQPSAAKGA